MKGTMWIISNNLHGDAKREMSLGEGLGWERGNYYSEQKVGKQEGDVEIQEFTHPVRGEEP